MLAFIPNRLSYINKNQKPLILIYGCSSERSKEISESLALQCVDTQFVYQEMQVLDIIKAKHPALIIIGGRCNPEARMLIRSVARKINKEIIFSEPGVQYENSSQAIVKDVLFKMKSKIRKPLLSARSLIKA